MLKIHLDRASGVQLSTQLKGALMHLINSGLMKPGDKLPTIKEFAAALHVNRNTVQSVYKELTKAEFLVSRAGDGTYVAPRVTMQSREAQELARKRMVGALRDCISASIPVEEVRALVDYLLSEIVRDRSDKIIDSVQSKHRFASLNRNKR